ncbi:MAG: zinc-dependent peptidase [Bacteroidia bacterium]
MNVLEIIGIVLLSAVVLLMPLFLLYSLIKWIWETFIEPSESLVSNHLQNVKIEHRNTELILSSKCTYYHELGPADKEKFLKRTARFILQKQFRATGMDLTEEMVVLISASAIQLTFGLDEYLLDHFDKIFIYPKEFYSRTNKEYHKGETNLAGVIVLSWKHFTEGYSNPRDNLNLGLHEMAHALRFDKFKSDSYDRFFSEYISKWQLISKEEFGKIRNHQPAYFREYAGTNFSEFFSVCAEYFFESSREFKTALPDVYEHLCILLNQDPATGRTNVRSSVVSASQGSFDRTTPLITIRDPSSRSSAIFVNFVIIMMLAYMGATSKHHNFGPLLCYLPFAVIGTILSFLGAKQGILFYENGLVIEGFFSHKSDEILDYRDIVFITFRQVSGSKRTRHYVVTGVLANGKIRKKQFQYSCPAQKEVQDLADLLAKKKVPVTVEGYNFKITQ